MTYDFVRMSPCPHGCGHVAAILVSIHWSNQFSNLSKKLIKVMHICSLFFIKVPWVGLQRVIVAFSDHTFSSVTHK